MGVDEFVDYRATQFEDVVRDVDVVLDLLGGETQERSWQVLKPGGILVSTVAPPDVQTAASRGVRGEQIFVQPNTAQLAEIANLIDAGQVKTLVETVLPLQEARRGHEMVQTGHTRGKIVLQIAS